MEDQLSAKRLLSALEKKGLISLQQARDLYANRFELLKHVERRRAKQGGGAVNENHDRPFSLIDAIVSLNLKRNDNPSKTLDEDTVYKTLADDWGIPFVKIDPLRLDLNVVTTTIPISFARNHLVLPIAVRQGRLTVATTEPL